MNYIWGMAGIAVVFAIAWLFSENKKSINWRTVGLGFLIQMLFGFIVLKWSLGREALQWVSNGIQKVIDYSNEGISFVFGSLADPCAPSGFIFAFKVLAIIIFFSSFVAVLYHIGVMQVVIRVIGGALSKVLGTSSAESLSAAGNIFLGQTESPLLIRPYIAGLTRSELFAVMVGGLASVAGSVLAGYAALGIPIEYLLAASFMAAPASLTMAKLLVPQTEKIDLSDSKMEKSSATNVIEAAANGAGDGLKLAMNVGAMLIAFIALIALLNGVIGSAGDLFGIDGLSMEKILGYLFAPIAFLIGVPWEEAVTAGTFIGQKLVMNEFVAFSTFAPQIPELMPKTVQVVTFALCGFANFSSVAILLGGLGSIAPGRRSDIAQLGMRAILAGTLANLLSAAIAGMFI
ncbi:MAG: NupC/NupG family nucleoside CNT transporter [Bacilli bacterium]